MTDTPEYSSWAHMLARCTATTGLSYKNYASRGITVCQEWRDSFEVFFKDLGAKPGPTYSIERIDNDLGYFKANCRWDSRLRQSANRGMKRANTSGITGVTWDKSKAKWTAQITRNYHAIYLGRYLTREEAGQAYTKAVARAAVLTDLQLTAMSSPQLRAFIKSAL